MAAACGGYALHQQRWDPDRDAESNLQRLAFSPDGVLLTDAYDIVSEDLDWRSGYERVLAAIATVTGRWWRHEQAESDVLGPSDDQAALVGEAKWQAGPVGAHDLRELQRKAGPLPHGVADPQPAFWARSGVSGDLTAAGVWAFGPADLLGDGESRSPARR